ncbi:hypothetical protein D3C78_917300 [compost metagenome]
MGNKPGKKEILYTGISLLFMYILSVSSSITSASSSPLLTTLISALEAVDLLFCCRLDTFERVSALTTISDPIILSNEYSFAIAFLLVFGLLVPIAIFL